MLFSCRRFACILLLALVAVPALLLALVAFPALAQPAPPPPPVAGTPEATPVAAPAATEADRLADLGRDAYRTGNYAEAYKQFDKAFQLEPRPKFLYNMARAKEKLADYKQAVVLLERYLTLYREQNGGADPVDAADVVALVRNLRQRAFEALPEVTIQSAPPGAQVLIEGRTVGSTPLTTHMEPGQYRVVLKYPDHADADADLAVPLTGSVRLMLSLKSKLKRAALGFWCNVRGAQIAVDGKVVAVTPFSGQIDVEPGRHQIAISRSGYKSIEQVVDVQEDRLLHSRYVLESTANESTWRSFLGWPLMILGASGTVGGGVASHYADLEYTGTPRFNTLESYQNLGYRSGGAALGVGLVLVLWDAVRDGVPADHRVEGLTYPAGSEVRPLGAQREGAQ